MRLTKLKLYFQAIGYSARLMYRSSRLWILVYFLLHLIGSTLTLLDTYVLKFLLDALTGGSPRMQAVFLCVALYALSRVLWRAVKSAEDVLKDSIFQKAEHRYGCDVSEKLARLPLSFLDSSAGKDIVDDVRYTKFTVVHLTQHVVYAVTQIYTFSVAFGVLARFDLGFSLLFLLLTIPGALMDEIFDRKAEDLRRKTAPDMRKFSYYRWMLTDAWPAKDVRMYDLTEPITARYDEEKKQYIGANKQLGKKKLLSLLFAELIRRSGEIAFTAFVVFSAMRGEITLGDVTLYTGYALTASDAFRNVVWWVMYSYARSTEIIGRVFAFFATPAEETRENCRPLNGFTTLVFDNVYFKYPHTENYVLSGVSFTLNRGDRLSIVGINGSGKSTIIKLMLGLYEIKSGQILLNGYPMSDYDIRDVRKLFSALFQSFVQYPLTLRENIALSDLARVQDDAAIEGVLTQSGVYDEIQPKLQNGIDSFMTRKFDDKGTELSKGQWQKIALSRAYFKDAAIIIFDEPSAALDAEAEDRIFQNFESMSDGKTGIMISHRISSARVSNKIIVLDGGKITECGRHDELVAAGGLYAKLYNLQREKYAAKEAK